ncbi:MAG: methyltransferase family protein [Bacteroidota bacterium]
MSSLWLIAAIAAWGVVHSLLASVPVKDVFLRRLGRGPMRLYRLVYNIFAVVSFLPILWLMLVLPDGHLYAEPPPWSYVMLAGQGIAVILLIAGLLQTGPMSFAGLRQLFGEEPRAGLVTGGLYRFVRHPLYMAGLLFMWLTPTMSANTFIVFSSLTFYLLAGAWFEERKLLREFGLAYAEYRARTPMLIPGLRLKKT